ncbi:hypothetical protein [Balneola vulgaris]|uniref:hypothetical protein n=1 Tax=Balneola vulgaris TaxID=287535 RepID=UPI000371B29A|nr:hypothetical protein [Balneola vulgaris]
MRTVIPSYLFLIAVFLLGSSVVHAQNTNRKISANINIEARIVNSIELITVKTITLGQLQPEQDEIYVSSLNDVNAGYMIAVGSPNALFRLNFQQQRVLTRVEGPGTLTFEYEISGNSIEEQRSAELIEADNKNLQFNQEGRYYIWVGGRVNLSNALPGSYDGDFTIEIEYI